MVKTSAAAKLLKIRIAEIVFRTTPMHADTQIGRPDIRVEFSNFLKGQEARVKTDQGGRLGE
jgi:hypothetical protein